jgi:phosphohistidine phosphatase
MQRTILFIRHAKSSWANPGQADYDRPLNERGLRDAPEMGRRLKKAGIVPDLVIASTAARAAHTARLVSEGCGYPAESIRPEKSLYHCDREQFGRVLESVDDGVETVAVVAHNPGISEVADSLDDKFRTGDMATCAIVGATFEGSWKDFTTAAKTVFLYDYPKKSQ